MNVEAVPDTQEAKPFDFDAHARSAVVEYEHVRPEYEAFCTVLKDVASKALNPTDLKIASIEARAKALDSFQRKTSLPSEEEPNQPRYPSPLVDITDLAGLRIIMFFVEDLLAVEAVINAEFDVIERSDKGELLIDDERFGYHSIHYIVKMKENRTGLPEYARFTDMLAEVQVRTILQHAWGEIEHDIQYKSTENIPLSIRRRFMSLAGLLELADREFQAIQAEDDRLREAARESVESGDLEVVEITPDAVKTYLDRRFGSDDRIAAWSYSWMATALRKLSFQNFRAIDECISGYNHDSISRLAWGSRQGQMSRFEDVLLAALGDRMLTIYGNGEYRAFRESALNRIRLGGIEGRSTASDEQVEDESS